MEIIAAIAMFAVVLVIVALLLTPPVALSSAF